LPGFARCRRFLLLEASKKPFIFLQSLDDEPLCFLTLPATLVDPGYCLKINSEDLSLLGFETAPSVDETHCLASWPWPRLACPWISP
jgi:flagellar assembly factor FliW